jgi:hypothetical protein
LSAVENPTMNETSDKRIHVSFSLQFLLFVSLLFNVYDGFFGFPFRKPFYASLTLLLLVHTFFTLRNKVTWQDFAIGVTLFYALVYFRFGSYIGEVSTFLNMPYLLVGLSLGLLFRYAVFPRYFFLGISFLALVPFFYVFHILNIEPTGQFFSMNRNAIARLLIFAVSLQVLDDSLQKRTYIIMFPSIATVWISFLSQSRTGFLVSIILLLIVVLYNVFQWYVKLKASEHWKQTRIWLFLLFCTVLVVLGLIVSKLFGNSRFASNGLSSSGRIEIYQYFLANLNFKTLMFGFFPEQHPNLHNSFFTLIAMYGVIGIGFNIIIVGALFRLVKISFLQFGLLIVWCLYSLPETIAPFSIGMFSLMPLLMLAYPPKRLNKRIFPLGNSQKQLRNP